MSHEPVQTPPDQHTKDGVPDGPGGSGDASQQRTGQSSSNKATVYEAAEVLGVTVDAIRKRIQRGTIPHERHEDGRVYVVLEASGRSLGTVQDDGGRTASMVQDRDRDELVEYLTDQVAYLRQIIETRDQELATRTEELRRKDHIVAALTGRIPELSPLPTLSRKAENGPKTEMTGSDRVVEESGREEGAQGGQEEAPPRRRSWLYRFFFGP